MIPIGHRPDTVKVWLDRRVTEFGGPLEDDIGSVLVLMYVDDNVSNLKKSTKDK